MKKFFKNLAAASLAIAGILVSSCKIEDINTTFEPGKAKAKIIVTVVDALHGNADISSDPALTLTATSTANNVIKPERNEFTIEGGPAIQEQEVTINAEYNGLTGTTTLPINSLLAGGKATYHATVIVSSAAATAVVQVTVWDNVSGKDVTAEAEYSYSGAPSSYTVSEGKSKGSYIISCVGGISAFNFEVTASYGGNSNTTTVAIDNIEKSFVRNYLESIKVGTAPEPVKTPAVVTIPVVVVDGILKKDVTSESTITAKFAEAGEETVEVKDGNVVTVTAGESLKINEGSIDITVKYGEIEAYETVDIAEVPEGEVKQYKPVTIIIKDPARYVLEKVSKEEVTDVQVGTFTSSHGLPTYPHDYSHATTGHGQGTGQWLYNETEFILKTTVDYINEYGTDTTVVVKTLPVASAADKEIVDFFADALGGKGYVKEPEQLEITVSAYSMYSVFCTKTTKAVTYNIIRREADKEDVPVGTVTTAVRSTQIEYCEAAIPGHEGHYHYGHGHNDDHGYSSNAGGGIFFNE